MDISSFITGNTERILAEWEEFAATFGAVTDRMSRDDLRDDAKEILQFIAADLNTAQTEQETRDKSRAMRARPAQVESASATHGRLRYSSGFTLLQLIAEYRALRASVLQLWQQRCPAMSGAHTREIMRFNEAVDQSLAEAAVAYSDKVNETRDVFLAILGHDLRSPLAAVSAAGALLARPDGFGAEGQDIGLRLKRSAATMTGMVNDLLALARNRLGGGIPIHRQPCDLLEVCRWAIEDASAAHPDARFELDGSGPLMGAFDKARLQQLLTNLFNNAAQYGARDKPIKVTVVGQQNAVLLQVKNEGRTIPRELLPALFGPLVQLPQEDGGVRESSSLGLGLFIAKQIALAHGGTIVAHSDERAGTVFAVTVPRS